jgi:hypothetical protein
MKTIGSEEHTVTLFRSSTHLGIHLAASKPPSDGRHVARNRGDAVKPEWMTLRARCQMA